MRDLIPAENMQRAKMGFGAPVGDWLCGPLQPLLRETVLSERALRRGYFRPDAVRRLAAEHAQNHADHAARLWSLLMLELWHREFIDRPDGS